jgi:hypothetical protein
MRLRARRKEGRREGSQTGSAQDYKPNLISGTTGNQMRHGTGL